MQEIRSDNDQGAHNHTNATVGELLEEWFALASPGYSPKGAADIDRCHRRLREKGGRAAGPGDGSSSPRNSPPGPRPGREVGRLSANPASSATPPRIPTPDINPPAPHELARLFALAAEVDVDLADYILLAAATRARRSELIALRWPDLDLDKRSVGISRGIVLGDDGLVEKDTKTHAARPVSLDPTTVAAMTAHRARAEERARLCPQGRDQGRAHARPPPLRRHQAAVGGRRRRLLTLPARVRP